MPPFQRAIFSKTLLCYLQALEGKEVTVELRNESCVTGTLIDVDSYMNLQMLDATYKQWGKSETRRYENLFVKGKNIRYVKSDDQLNVRKTLEKQIKNYHKISTYTDRKKISVK